MLNCFGIDKLHGFIMHSVMLAVLITGTIVLLFSWRNFVTQDHVEIYTGMQRNKT